MADLNVQRKKEWACSLYIKEGLSQKEIAEKVGVSAVTINKWVKAGKWAERKVGLTMTRDEQIRSLQLQIGAINAEIEKREDGKRFATIAEVNTITQLTKSIERLDKDNVGLKELISVGMRF